MRQVYHRDATCIIVNLVEIEKYLFCASKNEILRLGVHFVMCLSEHPIYLVKR